MFLDPLIVDPINTSCWTAHFPSFWLTQLKAILEIDCVCHLTENAWGLIYPVIQSDFNEY
jgi:hypothetical protein